MKSHKKDPQGLSEKGKGCLAQFLPKPPIPTCPAAVWLGNGVGENGTTIAYRGREPKAPPSLATSTPSPVGHPPCHTPEHQPRHLPPCVSRTHSWAFAHAVAPATPVHLASSHSPPGPCSGASRSVRIPQTGRAHLLYARRGARPQALPTRSHK